MFVRLCVCLFILERKQVNGTGLREDSCPFFLFTWQKGFVFPSSFLLEILRCGTLYLKEIIELTRPHPKDEVLKLPKTAYTSLLPFKHDCGGSEHQNIACFPLVIRLCLRRRDAQALDRRAAPFVIERVPFPVVLVSWEQAGCCLTRLSRPYII